MASCGDDLDQAFINIMDAVLLYLHTIEVSGERDRVFSERGITIGKKFHAGHLEVASSSPG